MCIDYRNLNKACHTEAYPVPRPNDVQEHLAGARVFSTLDLRSGYWQIPVRKEDQRKTAFCPGPGFPLFEW
ncbi:retrovirus polyprotein, putative, partial [Perkinsus marinus ATCC 50983]